MLDSFRGWVLSVLRVPAEPQAPTGAPGSLRVFRAARGYLWICLLRWGWRQAATLAGLAFAIVFFHRMGQGQVRSPDLPLGGWLPWVQGFEVLGLLLFLLQLPFTLLLTLLDYEQRWYLVTDRSLRIRTGIWTVEEMTMTYANVQELTVHQGPVQRLLGIADLKVRSAGGGTVQQEGHSVRETHAGYFHGVDNAEEIRDLILAHLRGLRDAGLGDPDEVRGPGNASGVGGAAMTASTGMDHPGILEAAQSVLLEARALRQCLDASTGAGEERGRSSTPSAEA